MLMLSPAVENRARQMTRLHGRADRRLASWCPRRIADLVDRGNQVTTMGDFEMALLVAHDDQLSPRQTGPRGSRRRSCDAADRLPVIDQAKFWQQAQDSCLTSASSAPAIV